MKNRPIGIGKGKKASEIRKREGYRKIMNTRAAVVYAGVNAAEIVEESKKQLRIRP